jgi:hypothetical protein
MHAPLRDHLTAEVREFFHKPHVLQQLRATWPGGHHVLIVGDWTTGVGGQFLLITHDVSFLLGCESLCAHL